MNSENKLPTGGQSPIEILRSVPVNTSPYVKHAVPGSMRDSKAGIYMKISWQLLLNTWTFLVS